LANFVNISKTDIGLIALSGNTVVYCSGPLYQGVVTSEW